MRGVRIYKEGVISGPYSVEEVRLLLQSGRVAEADLARMDDVSEWKPLAEVMSGTEPESRIFSYKPFSIFESILIASVGLGVAVAGYYSYASLDRMSSDESTAIVVTVLLCGVVFTALYLLLSRFPLGFRGWFLISVGSFLLATLGFSVIRSRIWEYTSDTLIKVRKPSEANVKNFPVSSFKVDVPPQAALEEVVTVRISVLPDGPHGLWQRKEDDAHIKVGEHMKVTLRGFPESAVAIQPVADEDRLIRLDAPSEWQWNIQGKTPGNWKLVYSLEVYTQRDGKPEPFVVRQATCRFLVTAAPSQLWSSRWRGDWQWFLSILVIPAFLTLARTLLSIFRRRRESRSLMRRRVIGFSEGTSVERN